MLKLGNGNLIKPKIIVARHGETSMNYRGELQGRSDGEGAKLNLKGIQQAGNLAVFFASHFINQKGLDQLKFNLKYFSGI